MFRLGIIGVGKWGRNFVKTINGMDSAMIACVCTTNLENAPLFTSATKLASDYRNLLKEDLDGVIITTPPHTHTKIIMECVERKLPFLVEKPLCLSYVESEMIRTRVTQSQVPCLVDHTQLFNPAFEHIANVLRPESVRHIISNAYSLGPFRKDVAMWWDWLPHDVSMALTLIQQIPESVKAAYCQEPKYDNAGLLEVELFFPGAIVQIFVDNISKTKGRNFVVRAPKTTFQMLNETLSETHDGKTSIVPVSLEKPLTRVVKTFLDVIQNQSQIGLNLAVNIARVIEGCEISLKSQAKKIHLFSC